MIKGGLFITLEGGEGSGKTTQIRRLKLALEGKGFTVVTTREPGGTPDAEKIRKLLVERDGGDWNPIAECLLLFAARSVHVEQFIKPALADDKVVICDRFTDSTRAYQGYGHGIDLTKIESLNTLTLGAFAPNLTFIMDLPVKEGLQRALDRAEQMRIATTAKPGAAKPTKKAEKKAGKKSSLADRLLEKTGVDPAKLKEAASSLKDTVAAITHTGSKHAGPPTVEDRYEQLAIDFHERMRKGYLEIAAREPGRCIVVNATRPVEKITHELLAHVLEF